MLSVKPIIRNDAVQLDGKTSIYLRLIYQGKSKLISTKIKILPSEWDFKKLEVKKSNPFAIQINLLLKQWVTNVFHTFYDHLATNRTPTLTRLMEGVKGEKTRSFLEYAKLEIANRPVSQSTKKVLLNAANLVDKFKPGTTLHDIDYRFLAGFRQYLTTKKNHARNTVIGDLSRIRSILNAAKKESYIKENPFDHFEIGAYKARQEYLTQENLDLIISKLPEMNRADQRACSIFCFMCFTGFRYSDVCQLDYSMLQKSPFGIYFQLIQAKTNDPVSVPLSKMAMSFLDPSQKTGKVFQVASNQAFNRQLEAAMARINLNKRVTTHMGRHTFVTLSIQMGMSRTITGKIAGHAKSETTDGYTHLQLEDLFKEISHWNSLPPAGI